MILIDTKHNEAFSNVSKAAASKIIGVSTSTITRWAESSHVEKYNQWIVYFNEIKLKQKRGFAVNGQPKMNGLSYINNP